GDAARRKPVGRLLRALRPVFRATLAAIGDAGGVERAASRVIANAGQILDATAADQHDGVFLQVVAFAADVRRDFVAVGQPHAADLAKRRVRLLRGRRVHTRANAALLRRALPGRHLVLFDLKLAWLAHELAGSRRRYAFLW